MKRDWTNEESDFAVSKLQTARAHPNTNVYTVENRIVHGEDSYNSKDCVRLSVFTQIVFVAILAVFFIVLVDLPDHGATEVPATKPLPHAAHFANLPYSLSSASYPVPQCGHLMFIILVLYGVAYSN